MAREHEVGIKVNVDQVKQKKVYHLPFLQINICYLYMFCVFMILRERARNVYYIGKRNGDDNGC